MWDGKVTLATSNARARYMIDQLYMVSKPDAEILQFLSDMDKVLTYETELWHTHAYTLEMYYRSVVLMQPVPQVVVGERK